MATDNVIIVSDAAATTTSNSTFTHIAGFADLGVVGASGTIDMANLPASITDIIYFTPAAGDVTISGAADGLTVDFHGNNETGFGLTVNGPTSATATLTFDFGNGTLALEDHAGFITTTGYSTVNINAVGNGVAFDFDTIGGLSVSSTPIGGTSAALTVNVAGTQDFDAGSITDVAGTGSTNAPTSGTDVINVTDTGNVDLGTTNFGTVKAGPTASFVVFDTYFNSTITGSSAGDNTLAGGDGGGALGTGNTINGGTANRHDHHRHRLQHHQPRRDAYWR